jgi:hypothetical protein
MNLGRGGVMPEEHGIIPLARNLKWFIGFNVNALAVRPLYLFKSDNECRVRPRVESKEQAIGRSATLKRLPFALSEFFLEINHGNVDPADGRPMQVMVQLDLAMSIGFVSLPYRRQ